MAAGPGVPGIARRGPTPIDRVESGAEGDFAEAEAWGQLSRAAGQLDQALAPLYERAGRQAGAKAAEDGDYNPRNKLIPSVYSVAYAEANQAGYLSKKQLEADQALADAYAKQPLNPKAFLELADDAMATSLEAAPLDYVPALRDQWTQRIAAYHRSIAGAAVDAHIDRSREQIEAGVKAASARIQWSALNGIPLFDADGSPTAAVIDFRGATKALSNPVFALGNDEITALTARELQTAAATYKVSKAFLSEPVPGVALAAGADALESVFNADDLSPEAKFAAQEAFDFHVKKLKSKIDEYDPEDEAIKTVWDAILGDDPEAAFAALDSARPVLDGESYASLARAVRKLGDDVKDDSPDSLILELEIEGKIRDQSVNTEQARALVRDGIESGLLGRSQATRLLGIISSTNEARLSDDEKYISAFFASSQFDFDGVSKVKGAQALQDYREFVANNLDATRKELRDEANRLVEYYGKDLTKSFPIVLYEDEQITNLEELNQQINALNEAVEADQISNQQYLDGLAAAQVYVDYFGRQRN